MVVDTSCTLGLDECLLCLDLSSSTLSRNPTPLESVWTENCAESVCKLLDLPLETFRPFFLAGKYCSNCKQMIRDVDYLIRSVESFQLQLSGHRIKMSTLLHENIETWLDKTNLPNSSDSMEAPHGTSRLLAPSSFRPNLHRFELKHEKEEQDDPPAPPLHGSPGHEDVDSLVFSVPTPENDDCNSEEQVPTPPSSPPVRVTRASNRLRKEISYREDSDPEESRPQTNKLAKSCDRVISNSHGRKLSVVTDTSVTIGTRHRKRRKVDVTKLPTATKRLRRTRHTEHTDPDIIVRKVKERKRSSKSLRVNDEEEDPTFDISNDMESGDDTDKDDDEMQEDCIGKKIKRSRCPPPEFVSEEQYAEYVATKNFLYDLEREEIEKNYSYICNSEGCNRRFVAIKNLRRHKRSEHAEDFSPCTYQCPFCHIGWFPFDYQLDAHIVRVHQGEAKCHFCPIPFCPARYKRNKVLLKHLRREHPTYPIEESRLIPFSFGLGHRDQTVMGRVPIQSLSNVWKRKKMVRCHVTGCPSLFTTQVNLDMHHAKVHDKDPLPYKCREPGCTKALTTYEGYWDHMKLKHGAIGKRSNIFTCLFCPYRTLGRGRLNAHMRRKHGREDVLKFPCKFCGHLYFVSSDCEEHEQLHTEETGWNCVIAHCEGHGWTSQEALRVHIQTGHDENARGKVICDICGSVHRDVDRLRIHTRVHTGEEPYKCRYCDNRFKNLHHRTRHEEITHADKMEKKTYNCKLCDETFTVRQYLYKHNAWHKYGANANRPIAKKKPI